MQKKGQVKDQTFVNHYICNFKSVLTFIDKILACV